MDLRLKTDEFLKIAPQFQLGGLVTESFHPKTKNLSEILKTNVPKALGILQEVDFDALAILKNKNHLLWELYQDIKSTLESGNKVFMCGCGATGRLSLVLETLFRQKFVSSNQVFAFMAGGDYALIKSVENFEDKIDFGERQLLEIGFGDNDLLLASTEGGETPFVLGAANKAKLISKRKPYLLYCNPDEVLYPIERSRKAIEDSSIKKINLTVGPMAISGSTRMQASTVLMLSIGVCLLYDHNHQDDFSNFLVQFIHDLTTTDYKMLSEVTSLEANLYKENKFLNYISDSDIAISILTDTTERSPTFSLKGFENRLDQEKSHALSYLFIPDTNNSEEAWIKLLRRRPRPLEWPELNGKIDHSHILGFDISTSGLNERIKNLSSVEFKITNTEGEVSFSCLHETVNFRWRNDLLFHHLMIKMLLNAHSTSVMGILDRFQGNVMTWVRPSNNKLIDRAARYVLQILKQKNKSATYRDVIFKIFEEIENSKNNESVVVRVCEKF